MWALVYYQIDYYIDSTNVSWNFHIVLLHKAKSPSIEFRYYYNRQESTRNLQDLTPVIDRGNFFKAHMNILERKRLKSFVYITEIHPEIKPNPKYKWRKYTLSIVCVCMQSKQITWRIIKPCDLTIKVIYTLQTNFKVVQIRMFSLFVSLFHTLYRWTLN